MTIVFNKNINNNNLVFLLNKMEGQNIGE